MLFAFISFRSICRRKSNKTNNKSNDYCKVELTSPSLHIFPFGYLCCFYCSLYPSASRCHPAPVSRVSHENDCISHFCKSSTYVFVQASSDPENNDSCPAVEGTTLLQSHKSAEPRGSTKCWTVTETPWWPGMSWCSGQPFIQKLWGSYICCCDLLAFSV